MSKKKSYTIDREVKKLADSLGVVRISHRRPVSKKTLISDLKQLACRLGAEKLIQKS